jgi:geranylgeranyl reductase family protein
VSRAPRDSDVFDVAIVGGGPAGSSAATAAAAGGLRAVILDRADFPRYKTCGGGLIGPSLAALHAGSSLPIEQEIFSASFTNRGASEKRWISAERILTLVNRRDFDAFLLAESQRVGATVQTQTQVLSLGENEKYVTLRTSKGDYHCRYVIGADGSASRIAQHVGVSMWRVDLGLEVELKATKVAKEWEGRIHLDWGEIPGSYAWVFPKTNVLTVGVIARKGNPAQTRAYLKEFIMRQGLSGLEPLKESGHLTRCRSESSLLGRGRVLLAGDAAGLLEPWSREGISFAIRSGKLASSAIKGAGPDGPSAVQRVYADSIDSTLGPEIRAGALFLRAFEKRPGLIHSLMTKNPLGWHEFCRVTRGETTIARAMRHRPVRLFVEAIAAGR